jgi:hypothetical protein
MLAEVRRRRAEVRVICAEDAVEEERRARAEAQQQRRRRNATRGPEMAAQQDPSSTSGSGSEGLLRADRNDGQNSNDKAMASAPASSVADNAEVWKAAAATASSAEDTAATAAFQRSCSMQRFSV